ncbi:MAG: hypothetical protein ACRD90_00135, partial [Nitrosopumilaceae archaeon]
DIESGKKVVVISYMVLLETIHTLRRKIPEYLNFEGESRMTCDSKKPMVHEATNRFVETIKELSRQRKLMIVRPPLTMSEHHSTVLKKIKNYFGYIRPMSHCPYCKKGKVDRDSKNECPVCHKEHDSIKKYEYKGLGHADLEHAFLAKSSGTPVFYSTDKSFNNLNGDKDFTSLQFIILPNPATMVS